MQLTSIDHVEVFRICGSHVIELWPTRFADALALRPLQLCYHFDSFCRTLTHVAHRKGAPWILKLQGA